MEATGLTGQVVQAILVVGCCPGNVRVVGLRDLAEELDVAVAEGRRGTHAAAVASAVESVGRTGGYLLSRELDQVAGRDGSVGLDLLSGAERPAGATLALVLHTADPPLVPPIHVGWQVLGFVRGCL